MNARPRSVVAEKEEVKESNKKRVQRCNTGAKILVGGGKKTG